MTSPTNNIYSSELKELGSRIRELYIYILAYEEVVLNPEKYLEEGVRGELVKKGIINTNQSINIEMVNRNTDLLRTGKYQYISFESLITGVSFNIFGYREGASPDGRDLDVTGHDDSLTKNISREVQLLKLKWFVEGTPAPIKKSNYGGSTLVDTRILNEIATFTNGGSKSELIASNGGFISSPFFEDEIVSSENYDYLFGALDALKTAFASASIFEDGNSNLQSISKDTEYNILNPRLSVNSPHSLKEKWATQLGSNYQTEDNFNLADIYNTLFDSLKIFGFSRDDSSPVSPINEANKYHQQFLNDVETIRQKLIGDTAALAVERSALLERNPFAAALTTNPEELILKKVPLPKLTPFDFQCFLLENISKLVDQREFGQYQTDYKNIVKVATDGDPGNIINTIQHGNKTGSVKAFLDICPEIYGLLVPYIKISRLEYDNLGNIKTDNGKAVMREMPIPNFLTQDDISDILSGKEGRAGGAGIKSFSWSLQGVQPAEVDNNIKATLVMYFQSINDFFNGMSSAGQETPNFLDLIINSPAVRKLKGKKSQNKDPTTKPCEGNLLKTQVHRIYDGANFRVKVCAGWATPPVKAITELVGADKAKNLIKAINGSRVSLFLQMTQHQINFNENGSLELTVDYQASLAGLLSGKTANIFDESRTLLDGEIEIEEKKIENLDSATERRGEESASSTEKKEAALEEIAELRNIQRNVKYRKLLKKVYSSNKLHNISLNPNELAMKPYGELTPEERQARVKRREDNVTYEFANVTQLNQELLNSLNQNMAATGEDTAKIYSENATKTFDELTDQTKINIPFFYLGDLFDMVLEEIKANNKSASADGLKPLNFNFFMSDVEMIDPLQAFKVENLEELINCGYDLSDIVFLDSVAISDKTQNGIYRTMNIGDIPISLDAFQLWFKNNVIKKNRDNYFFLYFVKDVCRGLITQALSSHCFGKGLKFRQRFDAQPLTLAKQEAKIANFRPNDSVSSVAVALAQASVSCDLDPTQTELGLLLYPTDSNPKSLTGEYKDDIPRGIYHHYLGSSCGLVKQINFQREDQEFLRETRIQKEGALGAEQLRELYSANIELVGNTLYKNGMYIYINPSLLSADRASLDYLGLHGYYLVTGVESKVTPSGFDVSIRALHEGIEFRGNKLLPSQVNVSGYNGQDPEDDPLQVFPREIGVEEKIAVAALEVGELQAILEAFNRGDINQAQMSFRTTELAAKTAAGAVAGKTQDAYNWFKGS
jgi:hypothetical protein